jgi:hypothetical protein
MVFISFLLLFFFPNLAKKEIPFNASIEQMGDTPAAEWILRLEYDDDQGMKVTKDCKGFGRTSIAEKQLQQEVQRWNDSHPPEHKITGSSKVLYYIPYDYAEKNHYDTTLCTRY